MTAAPWPLRVRHVPADGPVAAIMLAFLATAGLFYVNIMPALVDGMIHALGFSNQSAGLVAGLNVYGAAAGALTASFWVRRLAWKPVAAGLLLVLIAIDLLSMSAHTLAVLAALRIVDGLIGGFLVGIGISVIARTKAPDRVFGVLLLVQFSMGGLGLMVLPPLVPALGMPVVFAALILFSLVTLAMLPWLDHYPIPPPRAAGSAMPSSPPRYLLFLVLSGMFLFQAANMGVAAYILPLGEAAGLARDFMSVVLGAANWVGVLGSGLVILLAGRTRRAPPLLIALLVTVLGMLVFLASAQGVFYALANGITSITWNMVIPYLFGLCADFDRSGRIAVIGSFCSKMGLASGPVIAGYLTGSGDFHSLLWVASGAILAVGIVIILPTMRLDSVNRLEL